MCQQTEEEKKAQSQHEAREKAFGQWVKNKSSRFGIFAGIVSSYFHSRLYQKAKWRSFLRWQKKIEKHGVKIRRPWLFDGSETYKLHSDKNFRICRWDYYDICTFLLVKLTVSGVYFATHGVSLLHKKQMRECWQARKLLISAMTIEDKFSWEHDRKIREHFGTDWDYHDSLKIFSKENYLEGKNISDRAAGVPVEICADPQKVELLLIKREGIPAAKDRAWREKVLSLAEEISDYERELRFGKDKEHPVDFAQEERARLMKIAFEYIAERQDDWWD